MEECWNRESSESSSLTTLPTSSPTLTTDGESAILQWIVNEGHLLDHGDLKTAFLSGDPDPATKGAMRCTLTHRRISNVG